MARYFRVRKSLRDQLLASHQSSSFYAAMAGKPPPLAPALKPKRTRAAPSPEDSEGPVLAAVGDLLEVHPQVLLAVRQNSGSMPYERDGKLIPVWFYKILREPEELTLTDYWGFLSSGRAFAIECKRPSWKRVSTEREERQLAFIRMVQKTGGCGGFVRSADDALQIIRGLF